MADSKFIKVEVVSTKGSTPRNSGAVLWVSKNAVRGSIGGGQMEADAVAKARAMIASGKSREFQKVTLGTEIGQCCGGVVELSFTSAAPYQESALNLAIFGAGHVGAHLSVLAQAIGYQVRLIDSRVSIEIEYPQPHQFTPQPEAEIAGLSAESDVVILTHDHGLDFRLAERALLRDDLGLVGMIGSKSKSAQFRSQFRALGSRLDKLHSPIAKNSRDKRPKAIALDVLAALYAHSSSEKDSL